MQQPIEHEIEELEKESHQLTGYMIRANEQAGTLDEKKIATWLRSVARKWAFQLEEGESDNKAGKEDKEADSKEEKKHKGGYVHWQIKLSLWKKVRFGVMLAMLQDSLLAGAHLQRSSTKAREKMDYVMKVQTRVRGPWTSEDVDVSAEPNDLKGIELKKWQQEVKDDLMKERKKGDKVNLICNPRGQIGKTLIVKHMSYHKLAQFVPPMAKGEDIVAAVMCRPESTGYMFDIPRGKNGKKLDDLFTAVEQVQNGMVYDKRYHYNERVHSNPNVWVFTNMRPQEASGFLSNKRFQIWMVDADDELVPWNSMDDNWIMDQIEEELKETQEKEEATARNGTEAMNKKRKEYEERRIVRLLKKQKVDEALDHLPEP